MSGVITSSAVWAASFQRRLPESEVYVFLCILVPAVQIHQRSKAHAVHPLCHKKETWTFQYFSHIYLSLTLKSSKRLRMKSGSQAGGHPALNFLLTPATLPGPLEIQR